ncbi:hypothetical protein JCM24511_03849 [Saitozyma sp. JCM 24511]|nr:hypothetical protein JCM24511_03849 [Saitozyma sp. JCM 24511]
MPIPPTFAPTSRTVSLPTLQPEPDSHTPDLTHRDDEADAGDAEVNPRVEKRRRTNRGIKSELGVAPSPVRKGSSPASPAGTALSSGGGAANASTNSNPRSRANLPPIKPIGFAQSRESRDDGQDHPIPSPVVMGFDFKMIDDQQLRTVSRVRDTISIKEQQQALIAQRRRDLAASTPSTPKELTFKGWQPKDPEKQGVGRRREKTRDKVESLSIVTSASDKDVVPGSKSAPLNQALSTQQQSPRDLPSGSQTAMPGHILPPLSSYHGTNGMADPRTAPLALGRGRAEEHEFARQQGGAPYFRRYEPVPTHRPSGSESGHRRNFTAPQAGPGGPAPGPVRFETSERGGAAAPGSALLAAVPHRNGFTGPGPSAESDPDSPPRGARRSDFLQPFNQLYDLMHQTENLKMQLSDLLHRYESAFTAQQQGYQDFKATAAQAGTLLGSLQASADSLKEMVRYEVGRAGSTEKKEVDELRERVRKLEEKLGEK